MKKVLLAWICLAWCSDAIAQATTPLPLRPGFLNWDAATANIAPFDTIARPGATQIPGRVAYLGPYVLFVSGPGEMSMARTSEQRQVITTLYSPHNVWGLADGVRCSSVHGDKIVFVSITDGYVQPKRYTVVELSLAKKSFVRHYRSRAPVCATYSADGTHILLDAPSQQPVHSAF